MGAIAEGEDIVLLEAVETHLASEFFLLILFLLLPPLFQFLLFLPLQLFNQFPVKLLLFVFFDLAEDWVLGTVDI